ncbi:MAG: hypothetical protein HZB26_17910 [Candidatus Hydrogenedentes bacterium]|nr:hypothetical protein [Candidatus Hydrogenedentota bacterium]
MKAIEVSPWFSLAVHWGWALAHSVWMLTLIAIALACVLGVMKRATASTRYVVMLVALALMAIAPLAAFAWGTPASAFWSVWETISPQKQLPMTAAPAPVAPSAKAAEYSSLPQESAAAMMIVRRTPTPMRHTPMGDLRQRVTAAMEPALPWAVALWALGVALVSLRLSCGLFWVLRTAQARSQSVAAEILEVTERLREAFRLSAPVRVMMSVAVEAPSVIGWIQPIILLPPSALMGLTPQQLEMMIAHELAHLARYDHIVNVFQTLIETMLFYHPAVWWLSRRIREEREHCCDDCALALRSDRVEYARALAFLETQRSGLALAGLSAAGSPLLIRIRRLLLLPDRDNRSGRWVTGILLLFGLTAAFGAMTVETGRTVLAQVEAPEVETQTTQTTWDELMFPSTSIGVVCVREPGTLSFYDWRETVPASGKVSLPSDVEVALKLDPNQAQDLAFLEGMPPDRFTGLLLGVFYTLRCGNEPLDKVYANVLQTEDRDRAPALDADMVYVARLTGLRELYLDHSFVGDAGAAHLASLSSLDTVSLVDTEVTDAGVWSLSVLPGLRRIDLSETAITDQALTYLAGMPSLEEITLDRTAVTDAGVAKLAALPNLRRLSLNFTAVTDAGLAPFNSASGLTELRTWHTAVSPEAQAAAGHGTGQNVHGLATPRVGFVLSDFCSQTGPSRMPYPYSYRHPVGIAQLLISLGFDLYAVIDPGTGNDETLRGVLARLGLEDRIIDNTDVAALSQLDAIASGWNTDIQDRALSSYTSVVKGGVGYFNVAVFGLMSPGPSAPLSDFLGMDNINYRCPIEHITCRVVNSHPILGDMQPGDTFEVTMLNGFHGDLRGTPLLAPPEDKTEEAWPLYVYELGKGRVVNMQWQKITIGNGAIDPIAFYGRCLNYAAGFPVDATW